MICKIKTVYLDPFVYCYRTIDGTAQSILKLLTEIIITEHPHSIPTPTLGRRVGGGLEQGRKDGTGERTVADSGVILMSVV